MPRPGLAGSGVMNVRPARALGFPFAQAKEDGGVRDTEDLAGELAPLSALTKSGCLLTVGIVGSVPRPDRSGHSPWEGMSGAALFSGPLIVGVIIVAPVNFGTDRLEAVPTTVMATSRDSGRRSPANATWSSGSRRSRTSISRAEYCASRTARCPPGRRPSGCDAVGPISWSPPSTQSCHSTGGSRNSRS